MAENRKSPFKRGLPLILLALLFMINLSVYSLIVQPAYAVTITPVTAGGAIMDVKRLGSRIYGVYTDTIQIFDASTLNSLGTIACTGCDQLRISTQTAKVYAFSTTTIHEIDPTGIFVSRTLSISTASNECVEALSSGTYYFYCVDSGADAVDRIDVSGATITKTDGGSLNSGAAACDAPSALAISTTDDVAFLTCTGVTDRAVAVTPWTSVISAGDPDSGIPGIWNTGIAYDAATNKGLLCASSSGDALTGFSYSAGVISSAGLITPDAECANFGLYSDPVHSRFIQLDAAGGLGDHRVRFYDSYDFDHLDTLDFSDYGISTSQGLHVYGSNEYYIGSSAVSKFLKFDNQGLHDGFPNAGGSLQTCIDIDSGTTTEFLCLNDEDGDGFVDFDPNDFPWSSGDPADTIPAFFQVFGFNEDASNLIGSVLIHIVTVFGTAGVYFFKTHQNPPMFIWVAMLVFGGGISAAIGIMPLIYFFVEIALVVGAVATLVKTGVIGG